MQAVWKKHGKSEITYSIPDLQNVLGTLTNTRFAEDFFHRYIYGTEKNDYVKLLANAGLELRKAEPGKASIGNLRLNLRPTDGRNVVSAATVKGTAAYEAGIDIGDYISRIGNDDVNGRLDGILSKYKPGQNISVTFEHKGRIKTANLKLQESNLLEVVENEKASLEQIKFKNDWLSSKIK